MDRLWALMRIHHEDVFVSELADSIEERRSDVPQGVSKCRIVSWICGSKLFVKDVVVSHDITVEAKMPGQTK